MAKENQEQGSEETYSRTTIMVPKTIASELSRVAKTRGGGRYSTWLARD
ncbi:hypothetical protein [Vulcanisaeta distributa]|nr:hypothetical protein [Vulcanisaeta distributa]